MNIIDEYFKENMKRKSTLICHEKISISRIYIIKPIHILHDTNRGAPSLTHTQADAQHTSEKLYTVRQSIKHQTNQTPLLVKFSLCH